MNTRTLILVALLLVLFATGCADPNIAENNPELCQRELSGFWWGLWHGLIACCSFIGSLFDPDIAVYDVCNNGGWYDFGFVLGAGAFTKGGHSAGSRAYRWRSRDD